MGWLMEVIVTFVKSRKIINRGFLIGPYCPIYGKGALLIVLLLKKYEGDIVALFVMSFIMCSIIEYITSYILEKLFDTRWWDYSKKRFNLNGRICLDNLIAFGIFGVLLAEIVNPFFFTGLDKLSSHTIYILTSILVTSFIIDYVISIKIILKFKNISHEIKFDSTELVTEYVKNEIKRRNKVLYTRIINAFPNLKIKKRHIKLRKKN